MGGTGAGGGLVGLGPGGQGPLLGRALVVWGVGGASWERLKALLITCGVGGISEGRLEDAWDVGGCARSIGRGCACGSDGSTGGGNSGESGSVRIGCFWADCSSELDHLCQNEGCPVVGCVAVVDVDVNISRLLGWATGFACEDFLA